MAIDRIAQLRECGVFRDFAWPRDLPDMGRFNLIYGWNGTGKTTISRILRNLEHQEAPDGGEIRILMGTRTISGSDFPQSSTPIRVFNRDFIGDSVFPVEVDEVPPIYVFGTESVERQERVEKLKSELSQAEFILQALQTKGRDAENTLDRYCIARSGDIRNSLRSTEKSKYNNYNKRNYRERSEAMMVADDRAAHQLNDRTRMTLFSQHVANPKPNISEIGFLIPSLDAVTGEVSKLLSTTVQSKLIDSLKEDSELSEWVLKGLNIYRRRDGDHCLFCEQKMPSDRLDALEKHFNDQYSLLQQQLDSKVREVERIYQGAETLEIPKETEFYEDLVADYRDAADALMHNLDVMKKHLKSLLKLLDQKRTHAFEELSIATDVPTVSIEVVDRLNRVIRKHNDACATHQARAKEARVKLEADSVAAGLIEYERLTAQVHKNELSVGTASSEVERIRREVSKLEREIVQHRRPAEELNNDLHSYLGHDQLQMEIKDTGYAITRNGIPAKALSEGETTAIALLYFLRSLDDHRFDLSNGLVVLDDPVSSLDANSLYQAFGLIRSRTGSAGQLIVLTHNFTLFRLVRNWFHHLKGQNRTDVTGRPARFYMLDCAWDGSDRNSRIRALDPMLEQYESEYHYLFARIHRAVTMPASQLEENYVLPNMGRRLLESFLAFRHPDVDGGLWHKMNEVRFDETRKTRILRFVDTYSHADNIEGPEHDLSLLSESRAVLIDLLSLIKAVDEAHFRAMLRSVAPQIADGDGR